MIVITEKTPNSASKNSSEPHKPYTELLPSNNLMDKLLLDRFSNLCRKIRVHHFRLFLGQWETIITRFFIVLKLAVNLGAWLSFCSLPKRAENSIHWQRMSSALLEIKTKARWAPKTEVMGQMGNAHHRLNKMQDEKLA
jgi:hypothetical protein